MEIGPMSEWVAAIAEILAVVVALFLPYYTAYRASKSRQRKFSASIEHLTNQCLDGNDVAKKELSGFLNVGFLISNNSHEQEIITVGMQILSLLDGPVTAEDKLEIQRLLTQLS